MLYDEEDDEHLSEKYNIVRRDIWEGFVETKERVDQYANLKRSGPMGRFIGCIGLRCRFCKDAPPEEVVNRACVYPQRLDRIHNAYLRFKKDHIE